MSEWRKHLEPVARDELPTRVDEVQLSIAISLKRIADALNEPNTYGEIGSAALSGAILRGLRGQS